MLDRVVSNWPLKLLALSLAFAAWVSITGESDAVRDFPVPLEINMPEDLTLAEEAPTSVVLRLRAPETSMRRLDPLVLGVRVDVGSGISGLRDVTIGEENVTGIPRGVSLEFLTPNRLRLNVERLIRRSVPVEATFAGKPPEGYAFYGSEVIPTTAVVEGPESAVSAIELLRTPTVRLDQFTAPFAVSVPLVPSNPQLRVIDVERADVRVIVDAVAVERAFDAVPVVVTGTDHEVQVTPQTVRVTLAAPPALLDRLQRLQVVVDARDLEPRGNAYSVSPVPVFLDIPLDDEQRISIGSIRPAQVQVKIGPGRPVS